MSEHPTSASVDDVDERTSVLPVVDVPETVDPSTAHTHGAGRSGRGRQPAARHDRAGPASTEQEHVLAEVDRICVRDGRERPDLRSCSPSTTP